MRRETPEPWAAAVTGSQPKAKHSRSDARGANQDGPPPGHNSTHRVCEPSPRAALMPDLHRGEPWCKPQCLPHQRIHVRGATAAANRASMVLQPSKSGVPPARSSLGGGAGSVPGVARSNLGARLAAAVHLPLSLQPNELPWHCSSNDE